MGAIMKKKSASKKRRRRGERQKGRPVVLTQRDINLMIFIGLCRYCSINHIQVEFFYGIHPCRCSKRMRQLFDSYFLNVFLMGSQAPNLYSLAPKGLNELRIRVPELSDRLKLSAPIQQAGIPHHLAVVDTRLYISAVAKKLRTPLIAWSNSGGEITREIGLDEWGLKPDGIAELETENGILRIACEVDCGTETSRVLANKLSKYTAISPLGVIDELWFIVTTGSQRMKTISRLIRQAGISSVTKVMHQDHITQRPIQDPLGNLD